MKVFVYVRFAVRRGENLLPSFLNAVLCEFNVQKRCQTSNPEEENCLFSSKLSSWTPFICNEVLQAQPSTSGWGEKSSAHKAAQMGAQERISPRNPGTHPYLSFSPNLERTSTCRMLRCLITLIKLFAKAQEFTLFFHCDFLVAITFFSSLWQLWEWFPGSPKDLGTLPPPVRPLALLQRDTFSPGPATSWGAHLKQECQDKFAALPALGIHREPLGSVQSCSWAVTCQEPDHSQKL